MKRNWLKPDWQPELIIPNIPIEHLLIKGIKALVLDVDGTLIPSHEIVLHESVILWIKKAKRNFALHLLSNNPSRRRIENISQQLDINFTFRAAKPTKSALTRVLDQLNEEPKNIAILGDRLFTDILVGNRLGLYTVLVHPLGANGNPCKNKRTQHIEQIIAKLLGVSHT